MRTARSRAFSTVEVVVALMVLSVGLYAVAEMVVASRRTASITDFRIQAASLADLKLEEFRAARANLSSHLASAVVGQNGEIALPADGPQALPQNPRLAWQAFFSPVSAEGLTSVTVRIHPVQRAQPQFELKAILAAGTPVASGGATQ